MTTAFQRNAFQDNAFQIDDLTGDHGDVGPPIEIGIRKVPRSCFRKRKPKKKLVCAVREVATAPPSQEQLEKLVESFYGKNENGVALATNIYSILELKLKKLEEFLLLAALLKDQEERARAALREETIINLFLAYELMMEDEILLSFLI